MSFLKRLKDKIIGNNRSQARLNDGAAYTSRGEQNLLQGNLQDAVADFSQAIKLSSGPTQVMAYLYRARAYVRMENFEAALTDFEQVAQQAPALPNLYFDRGGCFFLKLDNSRAIADFSRAIALFPPGMDQAVAYVNRGSAYEQLGNYKAALADINKAIEIAPTFKPAYEFREKVQKKVREGGENSSAPLMSELTSESAEQLCQKGWLSDQSNNSVDALVYFSQAIEQDGSYVNAYYGRGVINAKFRRLQEALMDLNVALKLAPRFPAALTERGLVHMDRGNYDHGLADYEKTIEIDPAYALAYANKGAAYARRGKWQEALKSLDLAIMLDPMNSSAYFNRGECHRRFSNYQLAYRDFRTYLELEPQTTQIDIVKARLREIEGKFGSVIIPEWSVQEHLCKDFVVLTLQNSVDELVRAVNEKHAFYVVVTLPQGGKSVVSVYARSGLRQRLTAIADIIGEDILGLRLGQFLDLWPPCIPITSSTGQEEALQSSQRTGNYTLVVEAEEILGVFRDSLEVERRPVLRGVTDEIEYPFPGGATVLFGKAYEFGRNNTVPRTDGLGVCRHCGAKFSYYKPLIKEDFLVDYGCPECAASPIRDWVENRMYPDHFSRKGFLGKDEKLEEVISKDEYVLQELGISCKQISAKLDNLLSEATTAYGEKVAEAVDRFFSEMREAGKHNCAGEARLPLYPTIEEIEQQLKQGELPSETEGVCVGAHQVFLSIYLGYQYCPWTALCRPWCSEQPVMPIKALLKENTLHLLPDTGLSFPCHPGLEYKYGNQDFLIVNRDTKEYIKGPGLIVHLIGEHHFFEGNQSPYRVDPEKLVRVLDLEK